MIYYTVLIAQEINQLSAQDTAIRFLPMGATGFIFSLGMGPALERFDTKLLLIIGMVLCLLAPISSATISEGNIDL